MASRYDVAEWISDCGRNGKGTSSSREAAELETAVDHGNNCMALEGQADAVEMNRIDQEKEDQIPGFSDQKLVAQKTSGNLVQRRLDHSGF